MTVDAIGRVPNVNPRVCSFGLVDLKSELWRWKIFISESYLIAGR